MIEDVSYYLGLSLCSICSIICIYIILTLFIKGYQSSMHNFFALNICFVYLILNTIDSIPKFDWIRIKREDSPSSPPPSLPEPWKRTRHSKRGSFAILCYIRNNSPSFKRIRLYFMLIIIYLYY